MTLADAVEARPDDLVEGHGCAWGGTIVKTAPEMRAVAVRVDDPRLSGIEKGLVLGFSIYEVDIVLRCDA